MDFGAIMYQGWFLLTIYIVTGATAFYTVLVANEDGIHVYDPFTEENKTVLPYQGGVNSVAYNLQTGYVYSFIKASSMRHWIIRTRVLENHETHSCSNSELESWCLTDRDCENICSTSNLHIPKTVMTEGSCSNLKNLVMDWINNKIYWTCNTTYYSYLERAKTDGSDFEWFPSNTGSYLSVDVDPFEGKIFILEPKNLISSDLGLDWYEVENVCQFEEDVIKISVDTQLKIIYVVGLISGNDDERFLASLNYDGTDYKKLCTSKDPAWQFGPKVVYSRLYWLTHSHDSEWTSVGNAMTENNVKMESIFVPYEEVNDWSLVHLDAQKPLDGSICRSLGCSQDCHHSQWMKITCHCHARMTLGADDRTCHESDLLKLEYATETSLLMESSSSSDGEITDEIADKNEELKMSHSYENNDPTRNTKAYYKNTESDLLELEDATETSRNRINRLIGFFESSSSSDGDITDETAEENGEIDVKPLTSEITASKTVVETAENGSCDPAVSVVEASKNATHPSVVITASSDNTPLFLLLRGYNNIDLH